MRAGHGDHRHCAAACDVVSGERVLRLTLTRQGRAARERALAVGDEVTLRSRARGARSRCCRAAPCSRACASFGKQREQVIAANVDRLAIVDLGLEPAVPLRRGRSLPARRARGRARGAPGREQARSARAGRIASRRDPRLRSGGRRSSPVSADDRRRARARCARALADGTTVLAGHSGVGKSSLMNALEPELRLETGEISAKWDRGAHTTSRSTWLRLRGGAS